MFRVLSIVIAARIVWFGLASEITFQDSSLQEGDTCTLADGLTRGSCRRDTNCLSLKTIPQKDWKTCSLDKNSSIVCCIDTKPDGVQDVRGGFRYKSDQMCASFPEMPATGNHILNGIEADLEDFPYLGALALLDNYTSTVSYRCGANLISDRFMLTAAHCLFGKQAIHVRMGTLSLTDNPDEDAPVIIGVERVFFHRNYTRRPITRNDIALIKLNRTVVEDFLIPVCLYTEQNDPLPTVPLTIAGWGGNDSASLMSSSLMKASVTTYERDECNSLLAKKIVRLSNDQLCALGRSELNDGLRNDTCVGDSGGPLELSIGRRKYIVGLTSTGIVCGNEFPSIYTRISQFIDWIESIVWP